MNHYAIKRTSEKDELTHWKYIKKVKTKNGKWRYIYDKSANIYDVTEDDYDEKIKQIENTEEWKSIVARNDPEYVRTNKDGKKEYLIDDYLVNKKHPELNALNDIANGRKPKIHKIEKGAVIGGANDYLRTVQQVAIIGSSFLREKFKVQQGSYKDEIKKSKKKINRGIDFVSAVLKEVNNAR